MQKAVEIDFQGMNADPALRRLVDKHITTMEERFGEFAWCRVVIKAPSDHHRKGGPYEVNIHILLHRGRDVDVGRTATADERHADPIFAVNDAFKRALRRLQERARRRRGEVKSHNGQPVATVKTINGHDFGFLETADGREIYFHRNSVINDGFVHLAPGTRVTYCEETGLKGPQASTVKPLGKHGLR
jgi:cold shock CspA family protein/ribosome-associated translation inhibitor RaiA